MAVYSINQVRQLYVAKELKTGSHLLPADAAGSILVKPQSTDISAGNNKSILWFEHMGPAGITSSDKVTVANIMYAKATGAAKMAHGLARYELTLDSGVSATPVAGQEYILRIAFRQYIGLGEEDQWQKYGMVKATSGMTASAFYKELALSIVGNMKKDTTKTVNVYLNSAAANGTDVPVTVDTKPSDLSKTDYNKIIIEEVEQPWILGKMPQAFIPFTVQPTTITIDGDERVWGAVKKVDATKTVKNGHIMADLEYFTHGFRGDEYRGMGYPNNLDTDYLVDPTLEYNTIDIHYSYIGSNESVQKSEKDITILVPKIGATNAVSNKLTNDIIGAINTATGLSIATLPTT